MNSDTARQLIAEHLGVRPEMVVDHATFAGLGADSLDMIELAMRFEEAFEISIADYEGEFCSTVRDALELVHGKVAQREAA